MTTKEQLIEIHKKWDVYSKEWDCQVIKQYHYDVIADEILALFNEEFDKWECSQEDVDAIYKGWYPKEFVDWIGKNARINIIKMGIGLNSDGLINHKELNTDELYEYWKNLPK
jgi:hypothetical protein